MSLVGITLLLLAKAMPALAADDWDDFYNNFATDLTPLLALFGEQVTKQFLSESTSVVDNIIFAAAPLGILTAVVSVIRVCGGPSLRAFIGRAQEGHGDAEIELCSSTSNDVCELWNRGGIARVFGRPKILEVIHHPDDNDFYERNNGLVSIPATSGLHPPGKCFLGKGCSQLWREKTLLRRKATIKAKVAELHDEFDSSDEQTIEFAPNPNLSLNLGIKKPSPFVVRTVAISGFLLQGSVLGFALWATYFRRLLKGGNHIPQWAFPVTTIGTVFLFLGMFMCARLIETSTSDRVFAHKDGKSIRIYWLQQGNQSIGDQTFDAFAHSASLDDYMTSWKLEGSSTPKHERLAWIAISVTIIGFVMQFLGLRGLHSSVALFQLGATIVMAVLRAGLRTQRLGEDKNNLSSDLRFVEGHELDWQALQIEKNRLNGTQENQSMTMLQQCTRTVLSGIRTALYCIKHTNTEGIRDDISNVQSRFERDREAEMTWFVVDTHTSAHSRIIGPDARALHHQGLVFCIVADPNKQNLLQDIDHAMDWISTLQADPARPDSRIPNIVARTMYLRARLARLTDAEAPSSSQRWQTSVRYHANCLRRAIEGAANIIFSNDVKLEDGWKEASVIFWPVSCQLSFGKVAPVYLLIRRQYGVWKADNSELEAILGLWTWSLKSSGIFKGKPDKILARVDNAQDLERAPLNLRMWVSRRLNRYAESQCRSERYAPGVCTQHPLSVPLGPSHPTPQNDQDSSGPAVVLSVSTEGDMLDLCAQDIFTSFMNCIASVIQHLPDSEQVKHWNDEFRFANRHVDRMVEAFAEASLGSKEDGLMTIVPPLMAQSKLSLGKEERETVLSLGRKRRRSGEFAEGEDLLRWLYFDVTAMESTAETARLKHRVIRELGELYRRAIRSSDMECRNFGYSGIGWLFRTLDDDEPTIELKERYGWAAKQLAHLWNDEKLLSLIPDFNVVNNFESMDLTEALRPSHIGSTGLVIAKKWEKDIASPTTLLQEQLLRCRGRELVEDLLDIDAIKLNWKDETGRTILSWASWRGNEEVVNLLLAEDGVDVNSRCGAGRTPFSWAAGAGNTAIVRLMLERNDTDTTSKDEDGRTPLSWAAQSGHVQVVKLLLAKGASKSKDNKGRTPLSWATENGQEAVAKILIEHDHTDTDTKDQDGRTSLSWAAQTGQVDVFHTLLREGAADVNSEDRHRRTPLSWAAQNGHRDVMYTCLLWDSSHVDSKDQDGWTPLSWAAHSGHFSATSFLLDQSKVDTNSRDNDDRTPLSLAAQNGHESIVELLLAQPNVDVDAKDKNSQTPLFWAMEKGHKTIVTLLVDSGADPNAKDDQDRTPLLWMAQRMPVVHSMEKYEHIVRLLAIKELGTDQVRIAAIDEEAKEQVYHANLKNEKTTMKLLFDAGIVKVNPTDGEGRKRLSLALQKPRPSTPSGDQDGYDWNRRRRRAERARVAQMRRPLNDYQMEGSQPPGCYEAMVELLLTKVVDLDLKDTDGRTLLSWVAEKGYERIVKLLLDTDRAKANSTDFMGRPPLSHVTDRWLRPEKYNQVQSRVEFT